MTTKQLIKELQELDPSGNMMMMGNVGCWDYPVMISNPRIQYINDQDEWCDEEDANETVIAVMADN